MICTFYSHQLGVDRIKKTIQVVYPKAIFSETKKDDFTIVNLEIKGGIFGSAKKIKISYRERINPSFQLLDTDNCPLTINLKGLYGYVSSLSSQNEDVKGKFLHKIQTCNSEFSIIEEQGSSKELKMLIERLATEFDAILFAQPNTIISKADGQHFLDKNLDLILDDQGNCKINDVDVQINSEYFVTDQAQLAKDQINRKSKSESQIEDKEIRINRNLPCIESEIETSIRNPKEIAERATILAITNYVAFDNLSAEEAIDYLKEYNLWSLVTIKEREFLSNPTPEKKSHETWKCECIWTLLWALNKVEELGFPDELCDLGNVAPEDYPVTWKHDPAEYINAVNAVKSKSEILDANDFYYRLNWASVDARINGRQISQIESGVVYERQYALNWLINYRQQEWDDVSCNT